jgi:hypothetical protein
MNNKTSKMIASAAFLLGLLFDLEDKTDIFLQNTGLYELHGVTTQMAILFDCLHIVTDLFREFIGSESVNMVIT